MTDAVPPPPGFELGQGAASSNTPPPPEGFSLQSSSTPQSSAPPPPPGFEIQGPPQGQPTAPIGDRLKDVGMESLKFITGYDGYKMAQAAFTGVEDKESQGDSLSAHAIRAGAGLGDAVYNGPISVIVNDVKQDFAAKLDWMQSVNKNGPLNNPPPQSKLASDVAGFSVGIAELAKEAGQEIGGTIAADPAEADKLAGNLQMMFHHIVGSVHDTIVQGAQDPARFFGGLVGSVLGNPALIAPVGGEAEAATGFLQVAKNVTVDTVKGATIYGAMGAGQDALLQQNQKGYVDIDQTARAFADNMGPTVPLVAGASFFKTLGKAAVNGAAARVAERDAAFHPKTIDDIIKENTIPNPQTFTPDGQASAVTGAAGEGTKSPRLALDPVSEAQSFENHDGSPIEGELLDNTVQKSGAGPQPQPPPIDMEREALPSPQSPPTPGPTPVSRLPLVAAGIGLGGAAGYAYDPNRYGFLGGAILGAGGALGLGALLDRASGVHAENMAIATKLTRTVENYLAKQASADLNIHLRLAAQLKRALTPEQQDLLMRHVNADPTGPNAVDVSHDPVVAKTAAWMHGELLKMGKMLVQNGILRGRLPKEPGTAIGAQNRNPGMQWVDQDGNPIASEAHIPGLLDNYFPRYWEATEKTPKDLADAFRSGDFSKLSTTTKNMLHRSLPNGFEGWRQATQDLGLKPKYGVADTYARYMNSSTKAIYNKAFLQRLMGLKDSFGNKLISEDYVKGFKPIPARYLSQVGNLVDRTKDNYYAHPAAEPFLAHLFESPSFHPWIRALQSASFFLKRSELGLSGFHLGELTKKNLYLNIGRGASPLEWSPTLVDQAKVIAGSHPVFDRMLYGEKGDVIDKLVSAGMKISTPEDLGASHFYQSIQNMRGFLDDKLGPLGRGLGLAPEALARVNHALENVTFQHALTGFKLMDGMRLFEKLAQDNLTANAKNPLKWIRQADGTYKSTGTRLLSHAEIAKSVARSMNDFYGGQDWTRMAMESRTDFMRNFKLRLYSPLGRQFTQMLAFAPDWLVSNIRTLTHAIPGVAGDANAAKLHRYFQYRSGATYLVIANAINYAYTGHSIFQNKNMFSIEMNRNQTLGLDKSLTQPYNIGHNIRNRGLISLFSQAGALPRTAAELWANKQYITPEGAPPLWGPKAKLPEKIGQAAIHVGAKILPIPVTQLNRQGVGPFVSGALSFPIEEHKKQQ